MVKYIFFFIRNKKKLCIRIFKIYCIYLLDRGKENELLNVDKEFGKLKFFFFL